MSLSALSNVVRGKQSKPPRILIYGPEKIGKSTFGACAPDPIFLCTEDGVGEIDCARYPFGGGKASAYDEFMQALGELATEAHEFKTVVVDSGDWLERLVHAKVCGGSGHTINTVLKGFGAGYAAALLLWQEVIQALDYLRNERGMGIILICHDATAKVDDPDSGSYGQHAPQLHKTTSGPFVCQWADAILYAKRKMRVTEKDEGFGKKKSIAAPVGADGGERVLQCVGSPTVVAGNRYDLPSEIPLSWSAFADAMSKA